MRDVDVSVIGQTVAKVCEEINYGLSPDMEAALREAQTKETSATGQSVLRCLRENLTVAREERIPICQDTGMAVVFLEVGQEVHLTGGDLSDAVQSGVRRGYTDGYLRKSVVRDPLDRVNTGDNTPAVIHMKIVPGDRVTLTVTAKGFGSENGGRLFLLKPADGIEGVKNAVVTAVREAGANSCPPLVVGVGIGGTMEKATLMAKHALTREIGVPAPDPRVAALERELLERINGSGIGPGGLGGNTTALAVLIETYATHIAGLPVAVNLCCHANRHKTVVL